MFAKARPVKVNNIRHLSEEVTTYPRHTYDRVGLHKGGVHEPFAKRNRVEKHVWAADGDQPVNKHLALLTESPNTPNCLAVVLRRPRRVLKHVRCPSGKSDGVCALTKKITMFAQVMFNPTVPTDDISSTRGSSRPASWNL